MLKAPAKDQKDVKQPLQLSRTFSISAPSVQKPAGKLLPSSVSGAAVASVAPKSGSSKMVDGPPSPTSSSSSSSDEPIYDKTKIPDALKGLRGQFESAFRAEVDGKRLNSNSGDHPGRLTLSRKCYQGVSSWTPAANVGGPKQCNAGNSAVAKILNAAIAPGNYFYQRLGRQVRIKKIKMWHIISPAMDDTTLGNLGNVPLSSQHNNCRIVLYVDRYPLIGATTVASDEVMSGAAADYNDFASLYTSLGDASAAGGFTQQATLLPYNQNTHGWRYHILKTELFQFQPESVGTNIAASPSAGTQYPGGHYTRVVEWDIPCDILTTYYEDQTTGAWILSNAIEWFVFTDERPGIANNFVNWYGQSYFQLDFEDA